MVSARLLAMAALAATFTVGGSARANEQLARDQFLLGVEKMEEGGCLQPPVGDHELCVAARNHFAAAFELHPEALGALRNRALVEKSLGLVASARRSFDQLARLAAANPDPKRREWAKLARTEADELSRRVPRLRVRGDFTNLKRVTLDGEDLPPDVLTNEVVVDPGDHVLEVWFDDGTRSSRSFTVEEKARRTVQLPTPPAGSDAATKPPPSAPAEPPPHKFPGSHVTMATGGGITLVGLGLGVAAWGEHEASCNDDNECDPDGLERGVRFADTSTALTIAGGTILAAGITWAVIEKRRKSHEAGLKLVVTPSSARMLWRFE